LSRPTSRGRLLAHAHLVPAIVAGRLNTWPHAGGEQVTTHFDYDIRLKRQRLAELAGQTAELERRLADARLTLERELADPDSRAQAVGYPATDGFEPESDFSPAVGFSPADVLAEPVAFTDPVGVSAHGAYAGGPGEPGRNELPFDPAAEDRTEVLLQHGRATARRSLSGRQKLVLAGGGGLVLLIALIIVLVSGGASWPGSVAVVQRQAVVACRNPDVRSEPSQVNFACAKTSRSILWVFALLTSRDNPRFADPQSGRVGLEPITPAQGGQLAWSLNLHHPYRPTNPVDSLAVAARAINNIVGGATLTGAGGKPVVQAGLESTAANCLRYTGSAAMTRRSGFPPHCARPVTSAAGQSALVADIYQKWVVGAGPRAAQDAAVLFANAENPGNAEVQTILKRLAADGPLT
jgi:hypothetical protein